MKKIILLIIGVILGIVISYFLMVKMYGIDILKKVDKTNESESKLSEYAVGIPFSENDKYIIAVIECNGENSNKYLENIDVNNLDKVNLEGQDNFVIIPKYKETRFYIYRLDMNENAEFNETLIFETSNAFYINCNPSDLYSNVKIVAEYENNKYEYSPWYSLKDGSLKEEKYVLNIK